MIRQLLKGRFFGHPVHAMLIHFPTALFFASFIFDTAGLWLNEKELIFASFCCLVLGLSMGLLAAVFGFIDYLKLSEKSSQIFSKASWHAGIQVCVLIGFGVILGIQAQAYPRLDFPTITELLVSGILVIIMLSGNFLGGDLVFKHGIGRD